MMSELTGMRASDRDRQEVVDRLRAGLEDGRLTMEEYVDRMGRAYQAVTYGDLAPLSADLPTANPVTGPRRPEVPAAGPTCAAAAAVPACAAAAAVPACAAAAAGPRPAATPGGLLAGLPAVLKVLWTIWLTAVSVNVVVWALVSGTGGHLAYPWPLWVARPYGAVLFAVSAGITAARRARS